MPRTEATRPSIRMVVALSLLSPLIMGVHCQEEKPVNPDADIIICRAANSGNLGAMLDAAEKFDPNSPMEDIRDIKEILKNPSYRHGPSSPENRAAQFRFRDYIKKKCGEDITLQLYGL